LSATPVFDMSHYQSLNPACAAVTKDLLSQFRERLGLQTVIDVGCGLGYFSGFLHSLGFQVTAVDGRGENVEKARQRFSQISFHTINAEDPTIRDLGRFDIVLCFGLLYHLENPFLAIRHLHAMASKLLLVESVILPGSEPTMGLVNEGPREDQGLNHIAFYPTESCLVKLMYQAGFPNVYRFDKMPDHPAYRAAGTLRRVRTMLVASQIELQSGLLKVAREARIPFSPWDATTGPRKPNLLEKLRRYVNKPFSDQSVAHGEDAP
jgi:SAM-dependent methyltransferase